MKKLYVFILFLSAIIPYDVYSQEITPKKIGISMVPHKIIYSGLQLSVDYRLSNQNWLVFAPIVNLYDGGESSNKNYKSLIGSGFDISFKHFTINKDLPNGGYVSMFSSYNYYELDMAASLTPTKMPVFIHTGSVGVLFGYQYISQDFLFVDIYGGVGLKARKIEGKDEYFEDLTSDIWDFGYQGPVLKLGLKIGVFF